MRTPLKDRPFSSWSDEKLLTYMKMFQDFSFAYKHIDKDKQKLVSDVLQDLWDEKMDRALDDFDVSEKNFSAKIGLKSGVSDASQKKVLRKLKKSVDKR